MQEAHSPASHDSLDLDDRSSTNVSSDLMNDVTAPVPAVTSFRKQPEQSTADSEMPHFDSCEAESKAEIGEPKVNALLIGESSLVQNVLLQNGEDGISNLTQGLALTESASVLSPLSLVEVANLVNLIQELQHRNASLQNQVTQLEANLSERDSAWQSQVNQEQTQAAQLRQQDQEAAIVQDRLNCLIRELECSHQVSQRQQILIETVTGQLENSQERCAQLERECALTQQRHNEQAQLLQQTETTCRDLRSRLYRQQRYTLQFKAALEKCLEMPAPQYTSSPDPTYLSVATQFQPFSGMAVPQVFLPKVQSIQPWSTQPWLLKDEDSTSLNPIACGVSHATASHESHDTEVASIASPRVAIVSELHSSVLTASDTATIDSAPQPLSFNLKPPSSDDLAPTAILGLSSSPESLIPNSLQPASSQVEATSLDSASTEAELLPQALAQELHTVIDTLRELPPTVIESCVLQAMPDLTDVDASLAVDADGVAIVPTLEDEAETDIDTALPIPDFSALLKSGEIENYLWQELAKLVSVSASDEDEAKSDSSISNVPETTSPSTPTSAPASIPDSELELAYAVYSSSPSPIVYPLRTQKKCKSLAAIDLPSFPRLSQ